jgi:hypothetical protein
MSAMGRKLSRQLWVESRHRPFANKSKDLGIMTFYTPKQLGDENRDVGEQ